MTSSSEKQGLLHKNGGYGATSSEAYTNNYNNQIDPSLYSNDDDNGTMHIRNLKSGLKGSLANSISHSIGKLKESMRPFPASVRDMGGTSSLSNEMFNLVKNLIGAGAFGIPSGVATLAGGTATKWAMVPAAGIIILLAAIFGYYFVLLGRICKMTMAASYREAWDRSAGTRGGILKKISFLVPLSIIFIAGIGNVAYSMILADTVKSLAERFGYHISRTASLMTLTVFVLLPLCMVKKLSVLAPFSAVGTAGMVFTLVVMAIRCFDGSYDPEKNGRYLDVSKGIVLNSHYFPSFFEIRHNGNVVSLVFLNRRLPTFDHTSVTTSICHLWVQTYSFYLVCASSPTSVTTTHLDTTPS